MKSRRSKVQRIQRKESFMSIFHVLQVAISGCLGSCLLLQLSKQLEKESCGGKQFDGSSPNINIHPPSDLCRLDSIHSYTSQTVSTVIYSLNPHLRAFDTGKELFGSITEDGILCTGFPVYNVKRKAHNLQCTSTVVLSLLNVFCHQFNVHSTSISRYRSDSVDGIFRE